MVCRMLLVVLLLQAYTFVREDNRRQESESVFYVKASGHGNASLSSLHDLPGADIPACYGPNDSCYFVEFGNPHRGCCKYANIENIHETKMALQTEKLS